MADWKNYDFWIMQQFMEHIGCRPPYSIGNSSLKLCDTRNSMEQVRFNLLEELKYPPPCQSVEKVGYDYRETDETPNEFDFLTFDKGSFKIDMTLQHQAFKLIEQKKAYDFQSLVGNGGGYVGLFLGNKI